MAPQPAREVTTDMGLSCRGSIQLGSRGAAEVFEAERGNWANLTPKGHPPQWDLRDEFNVNSWLRKGHRGLGVTTKKPPGSINGDVNRKHICLRGSRSISLTSSPFR